MRVVIACEFSGIVREAFRTRGHEAWSVDLLSSETPHGGFHWRGDILGFLRKNFDEEQTFDLMIAHPPCTYLAVSGARWFKERKMRQESALWFVRTLMDAPIERICIENPVSVISTRIRKPDQYIQPWMFGHGETKKTGLWLKNLPLLEPTNIVEGRGERIWKESPGPDRWKNRSRTYPGIAEAMAEQWGKLAVYKQR